MEIHIYVFVGGKVSHCRYMYKHVHSSCMNVKHCFLKHIYIRLHKKHFSFLSVIIFIYTKYRGIWQIIMEFKVRFNISQKLWIIINNYLNMLNIFKTLTIFWDFNLKLFTLMIWTWKYLIKNLNLRRLKSAIKL